ncbi:hypothetical protein [Symbioplanes lichenis]|uniref:hypothetical protein n=1 Tax=Symbioplanes lichenis TaxID=1629072 RepID=UPI00273A3B2F|nr:hypothetical protein [Actinoplanes lichenis]
MADDGQPARAAVAHPLIPRQRGDFSLADLPPAPQRRRRRGPLLLAVLALVAVVALVAGRDMLATAVRPAVARPPTPLEAARASLKQQSAALLSGDSAGWLAAVAPSLRSRYEAMFASLRSLGVSRFDYDLLASGDSFDVINARARIHYCLTGTTCTAATAPVLEHRVTLKPVAGRWVIAASSTERSEDDFQPPPWDEGGLVFAQGKRVTLAALPAQKKHFASVLPIADAAALVNDKFATLVGNPQQRYRVYLAGAKQWKSWYGGIDDKWVVGYAVPLGEAGMDVVLNMDALSKDRRLLETTVQHELGHVVTIGTLHRRDWGSGDMWLKEGIAEYIGWYPEPATASWRRGSVHDLVTGDNPPTSIATKAMATDARQEEGDSFYGLGHFAAACLAEKYGQRALFTFVRLYLREEKDLDPASEAAFGRPFATVDKTCVAWIRDNA